MYFSKFLVPCSVVFVLALALPAAGQTKLPVMDAELAVPFGAAKGHLAIVADQIVFVASERPESSLTIGRADVKALDRSGDVVSVITRGDTYRFRLTAPGDLVTWYKSAPAPNVPVETAPAVLASFQARHDHRIGSCNGTLILTDDRVAFESLDEIDDSRQWQLADIKEVEQSGIYKLKVVPFFGDTFNFQLGGKGIDSGEYRRLVDRIARARATR